jgi:hypothetical protein
MTKTKRLILITLLLLFFTCKPKTESLPKEIAEQYLTSFVLNPNGIAYYKNPIDLKSKLGVIPYKAMFGREEGHEYYKKNIYAIKVWNEGKEGFILYSKFSQDLIADVISFKSFRASNYGVVESNDLILYDSPFIDSKIVKKLNQFTIVEKAISSLDSADWIQIIDEGKYLYTKGKIQKYFSNELAKQATQKKALNLKGYAKINAERLEFFSDSDLQKVKGSKDSLLSPLWDLYPSDYSELVGGKRYYKIRVSPGSGENGYQVRRGKKIITVKENPFPYEYLFVSEDNIEYIPEEKFTEYTIDHSNFKGDKKILYAMARQYPNSKFDLTNVKVNRLGMIENGESYHLVQSENINLLLKRVDGNYLETDFVEHNIIAVENIQDIDKDGLFEFFSVSNRRSGDGYILYGMKNGKYQALADVDQILITPNGIIKDIDYIFNEKEENFYKPGLRATGSFRYEKGSFIPIKIKYYLQRKFKSPKGGESSNDVSGEE